MRRRLLNLILFLFSLFYFPCTYAQDTILVFHPTVSNIKTLVKLSNGIMWKEDKESFHFLGVYHTSEQYNYKESNDFLEEADNADIPFSLQGIYEPLNPEQLYQKNPCSGVFKSLFNSSVGAIFLGGPDLPPAAYNEPMHLLTIVSDPGRHYMELSAMFHFLGSDRNSDFRPFLEKKPDYSILGICLGMQTMNVATGGTLIQDIPTEIYGFQSREEVLSNIQYCHRNYNYDSPLDKIYLTGYHFHPLLIKDKNPFGKAFKLKTKSTPHVLSAHHQCVEKLGKGLLPVLWSEDERIIEAVIHEKYKGVTAVQFHPEKSGLFNSSELAFVTADSTISYKKYLSETDSERFHKDFWKMIGENFLKSSATLSQ